MKLPDNNPDGADEFDRSDQVDKQPAGYGSFDFRQAEQNDELSALIRDNAVRYRADPMLAASIRTELAMQAAAQDRAPPASSPTRWGGGWWLGVGLSLGALASVMVLSVLGMADLSGLFGVGRAPSSVAGVASASVASQSLAGELIANHLRSLMVSHLNDVASTDQHTVKPWFQGKLDYAPAVPDFSNDGFPLEGGRLDVLEGRAVAALVYRRGQHVINVFVRPTPPGGGTLSLALRTGISERGLHVLGWEGAGMQYLAVTDANAADLATLSHLWPRGG